MGSTKGVIFCIKACFRHPFLMGMVSIWIFLYNYCPFMFSLLVWASPIFISTAVLLGTLLTYGKPNVPVIRKEDKLSDEKLFFRNEVRRDGLVGKFGSFNNVERFSEIRRNVVEKANSTATNFSDAGIDDTLSRKNAVLAKEKSREFQIDNQGSDIDRKSPDKNAKFTGLKEDNNEGLRIHESREKSLDQPQNKSPEKVDENTPTGSHWKQEDEGEEDDDITVSDRTESASPASDRTESASPASDRTMSDRTGSVSPGTSMTDISPIDELHPLLDGDAPQPAHIFDELSDATSKVSSNTISESSYDQDTDIETHGEELEVTDIEEGIYEDHDDDVKSAVSWTDDDHKNVINLGSSDLERNQRLENLIATRSLRKSMKIMAERNLIDLDNIDRPHNVAPISTARRNPFDLPDDLNSNVPGSAPSILAPRRNPFELSYDPGEEKHDIISDDYKHVVTLQPKDLPILRRNETFNAGPSLLGTSRHDYNFRPSYALHRKLSDLSESKAGSDPETESLGSVEESEDRTPIEEDDSREPVVTTIAEHPSEDVGHGSESSENEDTFQSTDGEKKVSVTNNIKVNLGEVDNSREKVSSLSESAVADTRMEGDTSEATEVVTPDDSSSTSMSEEHGHVFNVKEGEQMSHFKPTMEGSDAEITRQSVDDTHHKEPVYDSSPTARLSSSSLFSNHQVEIVVTNSPPVSVERTIENESDVSNQVTEKDTPATDTDEKLVSTHDETSSENNTSIHSDKELPVSDQSVVKGPSVKYMELQDSAKCVNASEVQELVKETQQNSKPTISDMASTQSEILDTEATPGWPDSEDNIPCVRNSDASLISENRFIEKTGSGPADSEEVPSQDATDVISDMPVESGTVEDKEARYKEDEHTEDGSGEPGISTQEHNLQHVGNSDTISISGKPLLEKTDPRPAGSEVPSQNAGDANSDMPVESGTIEDKEPRYKEDEHTDDGSGEPEISTQEPNMPHVGNSDTLSISKKPLLEKSDPGPADSEETSRNAGDAISDMPVEPETIVDKELHYKEDEHTDDGSGEPEISTREHNIPQVEISDTISISEKPILENTEPGPADSQVPSQNAEDKISDMPVELGTVKDKESCYEEDKHADDGSSESEISSQGRLGLEAEVGLPVAEAQSLEDVKSAEKQVDGVEVKKPPDLSPNETKGGYYEHELPHRSSVLDDENGSELSRSVQDSNLEQHHDDASDKTNLPDSNVDDTKQSPQPKSWWSPFGRT